VRKCFAEHETQTTAVRLLKANKHSDCKFLTRSLVSCCADFATEIHFGREKPEHANTPIIGSWHHYCWQWTSHCFTCIYKPTLCRFDASLYTGRLKPQWKLCIIFYYTNHQYARNQFTAKITQRSCFKPRRKLALLTTKWKVSFVHATTDNHMLMICTIYPILI